MIFRFWVKLPKYFNQNIITVSGFNFLEIEYNDSVKRYVFNLLLNWFNLVFASISSGRNLWITIPTFRFCNYSMAIHVCERKFNEIIVYSPRRVNKEVIRVMIRVETSHRLTLITLLYSNNKRQQYHTIPTTPTNNINTCIESSSCS